MNNWTRGRRSKLPGGKASVNSHRKTPKTLNYDAPAYCYTFFLFLRKKKETKKTSPAYNITAKNLLERASLDKLLASLVGQYLRSPFSYGFINAVNCNAGFYLFPPTTT